MINRQTYLEIQEYTTENPEINTVLEKAKTEHFQHLSVVSHEIMNQLSFLGGTYQLLSARYPETATYPFWSDIGKNIRRLNKYMERTSICRYIQFPTLEAVDAANILYALPDEVDEYLDEHPRDFVFDVPKEPLMIVADSKHLTYAFVELLVNAIEASEDGDAIQIIAEKNFSTCDHGILEISIVNPGKLSPIILPITADSDENNLHRDATDLDILTNVGYTTKNGHAGIGLSIVQTVCLQHKGDLSVFMQNDCTHFKMTIPLA